MCIYIYICVYIYMYNVYNIYIYMCIYIYIHTISYNRYMHRQIIVIFHHYSKWFHDHSHRLPYGPQLFAWLVSGGRGSHSIDPWQVPRSSRSSRAGNDSCRSHGVHCVLRALALRHVAAQRCWCCEATGQLENMLAPWCNLQFSSTIVLESCVIRLLFLLD